MQKGKHAYKRGLIFALMLLVMVFATGMTSVEAATVKLNKTSTTLYTGKTTTLKLSGTSKTVKWSSSNKSVAKVSSKGKVTAVSAGTATIKAKVGSKTYSCKVTVKDPYLSKTSSTLIKGATTTLKLNGATIKSVSSSKKSVATVSKTSSGAVKITSKKTGTATVTVKDTNGNKYKCKVTVRVGLLSTSSTKIIKGASKTLTLNCVDIKSVSSSKKSVATVSKTSSRKFKITAKKAGTTTITVKDKYGNSYKCKVTVRLGVLGATSLTVKVGNSKTLNLNYVDIKSVSSSKKSVATVSKSSSREVQITGKKAGTTTITIKDKYGNSYKCKVTVKNVMVTAVSLNKSALTLDIGGTSTLKATASPSNATNSKVNWSSSNTSVATVSSSGKVTAVAAGTATITATAADGSGQKAKCTVTVNPQLVTQVKLNSSSLSLEIGGTSTLKATVSPSNATNTAVKWSSSNTSVATVSSSGKVTAVAAGTATITAAAADGSGKNATCKITVNKAASGESASEDSDESENDSTEGDTEESTENSSESSTGNTLVPGEKKSFSLEGSSENYTYDYVEYTYTPATTGTCQLSMMISNRTTIDGGIALYQGDTYLTYGKWYYLYEDETGSRSLEIYLIHSLMAGVEYTFRVYSSEAVSGTVVLQNYSFALSGVTGDVSIYDVNYYKNYASIYLCGETVSVPEFEVILENSLDVSIEESGSYEYGDVVEWIYLTDSSGGSYTYKIYYNIDPSVFELKGVSGDGAMVCTSASYYNESAYIKIAGTQETLTDALTLYFRNDISWKITKLEDDYATVELIYQDVATYYLYIDYVCNPKATFAISDVTGTDITSYNTLQYDNYGYLNIYGLTSSMPDLTLTVNTGINYEISTDSKDYSAVITMTSGDSTYTYYVNYYYDTEDFEILGVTGDVTRASWHTDNNYDGQLYLYGLTSTMPVFGIETKDGVTYKVITDGDDTSLVLTSGSRTYTYQVYYSFDSNLFKIDSINGSGIYNYSSSRTAGGGTLYIYGTKAELSDYTVTLTNADVAVVSQSSTALVLEYGDYTYTYSIEYYYTKLSEIVPDEEISVVLQTDTSGIGFTFTPEEDGTYTFYSYSNTGDPYCALYQGETCISSDDDSGDGLNFSLTYELEAGVEYTFIVEEIRESGSCTVKLVQN